jgi:OOP family OmpA-OmpF porin
MNKIVLSLLLMCAGSASVFAQADEQDTIQGSNDFNKWSIDINGGLNKATNPMAKGYYIKATNFFHADLGFRYMFNTKFGLKLEGGYDVLNNDENSLPFKTEIIRLGLQGYVNLGRVMQFETFTKRLNVLGHVGVGVAQMTNDRYNGEDHIGNFILGLTAQYKLADRVALNADVSMLNNFHHHRTWDGSDYDQDLSQGFDSTLYNVSLGLSIYLGKHQQHADWFIDEKKDDLEDLELRLAELETMMDDSDKDGVPDYLDSEPNTITGVAVDSKGRTIDKNGNGVPDELESYIENKNNEVVAGVNSELAGLINGGYVNVYFDFNKDQPNAQSVNGINFLVKYLKENPNVSSDVIGYADEVGDTAYNQDLSRRRAENVKQILVDAGIAASRLNIKGSGEDSSVSKDSPYARQIVRRVTFILK